MKEKLCKTKKKKKKKKAWDQNTYHMGIVRPEFQKNTAILEINTLEFFIF